MLSALPHRGIGLVGWYFVALQLYLAWASFRGRQKVAQMATLPTLTRHYTTAIIMQGLFLGLAVVVALYLRIPLFPRTFPKPLEIAAGLAAAAFLACAIYPIWKRSVAARHRRLYFFIPRGGREKALWTGVSLAAGIGEEATYRGVLYVPMLAHVVYDIIAGFTYARLGREMGDVAEGAPGAAGATSPRGSAAPSAPAWP